MGNITLIKNAIRKQERYIASFTGDSNPQVKEMLAEARGRKDALEACLLALRGDRSLLRIMGRSHDS
jgi:hypothetical protein